ncbi:MAG: hypothetical protein KTR25_07285 [Myxococcales bacterium]|nr:hypothetical protein [Myxococcales bacterium]
MDSANEIITHAIEALRGEAQAVEAKIAALENSLSLAGEATPTKTPRRGRPRKVQTNIEVPTPKKTRAKAKEAPVSQHAKAKESSGKDTIQTAAEKRSKSWDSAKKAAAAERMRKYWASRKKEG